MRFNRLIIPLLLTLTPVAIAGTTWYVNGVNGSNTNDCKSPATACKTIGHALPLISSGDSIRVASATYNENLTIGISMKIVGSGANTTIIDGGGVARVVTISSNTAHVTLSGITITHGRSLRDGGGIINNGLLTLLRTAVTSNRAQVSCPPGQHCGQRGGGIFNAAGATLIIGFSTISGKSASIINCSVFHCGAAGGGIYNGGTLTLYNSTVSGNTAGPGAQGSGIYSGGTAVIRSSTLANNGTAIGAGIYGTANLENTIVVNGISSTNCGGAVTSSGYNLSNDGNCNFTNAGDLNNTDPLLGPLQYNGGPTQTMALPVGSPAVDAGNPNGCADGLGHLLKTDQRGKARPDAEDGVGCDIGAYEFQAAQAVGHCAFSCGSVRCGALTGFCVGSVNNACRSTFDTAQCPAGRAAGGSGSSCGQSVDTTRTCTP